SIRHPVITPLPSFPTRRSSDLSFCPKVRRIAGPAISRAASRLSHRISARPRPHHSFTRFSSFGIQDPGFPQRNRRSFAHAIDSRSEEHTSELQSLAYIVCRLLL